MCCFIKRWCKLNWLTTAAPLRESSIIPSGMVLMMATLGLAMVFKAIPIISLISDTDVAAILEATITTSYTKTDCTDICDYDPGSYNKTWAVDAMEREWAWSYVRDCACARRLCDRHEDFWTLNFELPSSYVC